MQNKSINKVIAALREHIADRHIGFVFPSQTSASLWARKTCTLGIARSVEAKRFIAWDRFKEDVGRREDDENDKRKPASSVIRRLFAEAVIRKNAEVIRSAGDAALPLFARPQDFSLKSLVPPQYAESGRVFAPFIARLLPSLAYWEKARKKAGESGLQKDVEDEDYEAVKKEYAAFLNRYELFEPSWEEINIRKGDMQYIIFFPELIEDFAEFDALLEAPRFTRIKADVQCDKTLVYYQSAREEIRSAVIELQRLHEEEGLPYEEMAVSVPDLNEMEPCLLREFALKSIPVTRRAGKKLGETGAGRLFSLISECASSRFSFNSLKALILNDHIPWKDRKKNKALINFGIKYNCVSSYLQNGGIEDIWEEAFKQAYSDGGRELAPYYRELKKSVLALAGSENFAEMRKYYFAFRGVSSVSGVSRSGLLDMEIIAEDDDAVLSRCIEELNTLIDLEEKFDDPAVVPASPISFLISCLNEKEYVPADQMPGVNIFKWRVAVASPFTCHFVLNASQSAASVLYQPMKFLRQDKRKALGLEDRDATGAFFALCDTGSDGNFKTITRISASAKTFSGWAIPHSFFAQGKTAEAPQEGRQDPYKTERLFWKNRQKAGCKADCRLTKIFPLQKRSYEQWKNVLAKREKNISFFDAAVPAESPAGILLKEAVLGKDELLTVSPTRDLNVYYNCSLLWLFSRVFEAEEYSLESALLDDISLGLLYHKILENVFGKIKDEDEAFDSRRLETYRRWVFEITKAAIKDHPAFKGPLAVPLVYPQAVGLAKKISALLVMEAKKFDGYGIEELEIPVSYKTGGLLIKGTIDRISVSPEGEPSIIDYKTSYLPEQTDQDDLEEIPLSEFQMPLYIKLYEERLRGMAGENAPKAAGAHFYSINGNKIKTVMGESSGRAKKAPTREEYEPFLEAAERQIEEFAAKVKALDFIPREVRIRDCLGCNCKTICRSVYR